MKLSLLLIFVFSLASCNNFQKKVSNNNEDSNKQNVLTVKINDIVEDVKFSDFAELDSLIFLECSDSSLIGNLGHVTITNDRIYTFDKYNPKGLFGFDTQGKFVNAFKNVGRGPNEYNEIIDISHYSDQVFVLVSPLRILVLDKDLYLKKSIELKWPENEKYELGSIEAINNDTLLISSNRSLYKFNFYSIKKGGFFARQSKPLGDNIETCYPEAITAPNGDVYVTEIYKDTVFVVRNGILNPLYFIDFEKPMSNEERYEHANIPFYDVSPYKKIENMYDIGFFCESNDHIMFTFTYNVRTHYCYYNKKTGNKIIIPNNIPNDLLGAKYLYSTLTYHGNSIVSSVMPNELIANRANLGFSLPKNFSEESNPVLVFYHYKHDYRYVKK